MLSDFGLATRLKTGKIASPQGYVYHIAPETIEQGITDERTDIYAAGVTLYRLLNGDEYLPSFGGASGYANAILDGTFPKRSHYRLFIPRNLKIVVNRAMNVDPDQRYQSATDFRHALEAIHIGADWVENPTPSGTEWTANLECGQVRVRLTERRRGKWSVDTCRRVASPGWRRASTGCADHLPAAAARRLASRVLVAYVGK